MSKLNIDRQTIKELFQNKRSDFLIPDYQRPYAWGLEECQMLRGDIFAFMDFLGRCHLLDDEGAVNA